MEMKERAKAAMKKWANFIADQREAGAGEGEGEAAGLAAVTASRRIARQTSRPFSRTAMAAASLGQVHRATLKDGRQVAVKFLYPKIRGMIGVDMRVLGLAILVYKRFVPVAKIERVHESLVDLLRRETDYLHEAECMTRMAKNFAGEPGVGFPAPITELTTRDVLTVLGSMIRRNNFGSRSRFKLFEVCPEGSPEQVTKQQAA